ncbi:MAG: L,D-transpeptidase family protein, partial [Desulfobulbaceae bacterium]|nr:L,D-transpeptidase family protein [Desulfobulbaceae bacterium]
MRPVRFALLLACCLALVAAGVAAAADAPSFAAQTQEAVRQRLEAAGQPGALTICHECLYDRAAVQEFYLSRLFQPAWSEEGRPTPLAAELASAIRAAEAEGLMPEHYHLKHITALLSALDRQPKAEAAADLDLLLTDAFLVLGSHFLSGRINPTTIDPEWLAKRREGDLPATLRKALASNDITATLQTLLPQQQGYAALHRALARYRQLVAKGGWPTVPTGPKLEPGARGPRVAALRGRLAAEGDLAATAAAGDCFDDILGDAVRHFQARHGLDNDGVVGAATLAALNVPSSQRARQLVLNLERWRWLPPDLGQRHILINIAAFQLAFMEGETPTLAMRVVVGKPYRRTPVFSGTVTYLVLNPAWEVPSSIAAKDILPEIRKDRHYIQRLGFRVFQGWGAEARAINPATANRQASRAGTFPYRLRQEPGPLNALGRVKFMFPNPYNVYLHDTPARDLFQKEKRTFSSG